MTSPARAGATLVALTVGLAVGTIGFTFSYGQGASYLSNDPQVCANCHVMQEYLTGWMRSSHRAAATCNECHAPHDFVGKMLTKARNGWAHSVAFTTGNYPEHMQIKPFNLEITEGACRECHSALVDAVDSDEPRLCVTCHADVAHPTGAPLLPSPGDGIHRGTNDE